MKNNSMKVFAFFTMFILLYCSLKLLFTKDNEQILATADIKIPVTQMPQQVIENKTVQHNKQLANTIENDSNGYQKNGLTYFEAPNHHLQGGLAQHYLRLKSEADSTNAQSAYLLGINLQTCLTAPLDADEVKTSIEFNQTILAPDTKNYTAFTSSMDQQTMRNFYYCEGITLEQRLEYVKYLKLSIAGGNIYAASSHIDFDFLVRHLHKHEPAEKQQEIIIEYFLEHRSAMIHASKQGSISAMFLLESHFSEYEYSVLKNNNALVEALKYNLVLQDYADNEFQPFIQKRIDAQLATLTPQEIDAAYAAAQQLNLKIINNKTIYKMNRQVN